MQFNGGVVQRCVGIVVDRFKAKALRNLESENHWMEHDTVGLIRVLRENHFSDAFSGKNFPLIFPTLEDIMATVRALQLVVMDDSFKLLRSQNPLAREVEDIIGDMGFWTQLEAVLSLTKSAMTMAQEIETSGISWSPSSPLVVFSRAGDRGSVVSW
ncbi:hypothetical protein AMTR_s00181p00023370 [Amborella trichopoda]|uniref:Uncharacterized protein n=1 Tax=Amborella trichopoda TaxID=13333 RepID=W1P7S3_AMBTC|nr:hypothetical protein AMTR_s00181p00023370 [Amborella trichopoda]